MNEQVKQIWIDALTSGEYNQTTGTLKNKDNYCCLGVLCDLYMKETGKGRWSREDCFYGTKPFGSSIIPNEVAEWAGVENTGQMNDKSLWVINDRRRGNQQFLKIAEIIEENS